MLPGLWLNGDRRDSNRWTLIHRRILQQVTSKGPWELLNRVSSHVEEKLTGLQNNELLAGFENKENRFKLLLLLLSVLRFEGRFRKAPFWRQVIVDSRPDRRNKVAFSKFSEVVGTLQSLVSSPSLCPNLALQRKFLHAVISQEWFCYIPSASTAQKLCPDHVFVYRFCVACGILRLCINLHTKQPH